MALFNIDFFKDIMKNFGRAPDEEGELSQKQINKQFNKYLKDSKKGKGPVFDTPIKDKYYNKINKQEKRLSKGKEINVSSPMSERYYFDGDIGQKATVKNGLPNAKTSGYTGLYTKRQMNEAGEKIGQKDVDTAEIASTAVANIRYVPKSKNLYIQFVGNDKEYLYPNVPVDVARKFLNAESKGRYVGNRLGKYAVSADEAKAIKARYKGK